MLLEQCSLTLDCCVSYDTQLTPTGQQQADSAAAAAAQLHPVPEVCMFVLRSSRQVPVCRLFKQKAYFDYCNSWDADTAAKPLLLVLPQVLLVSPLSRALDTAARAFRSVQCPRVVEPLAAERIWLSSDVGTPASQLAEAFPQYDLTGLDEIWWHTEGATDPKAICPESEGTGFKTPEAQMGSFVNTTVLL